MKPVLFNTNMVKAILDGRKTVTRRICKDANQREVPLNDFIDNERRTYAIQSYSDLEHLHSVSLCEVKMPICKGDILYVRETWQCLNPYSDKEYVYKASCDVDFASDIGKWLPSIHMPKEAARIFLRVTDVRVERLQDINGQGRHDEFLKEGYPFNYIAGSPLHDFVFLWNSTIKKADLDKYDWHANPWVWVIEFERISKEDAYDSKC
jgi:hypothetical protein|nr:hypothetical protein [uncultured Lachnoclostridium sp.]